MKTSLWAVAILTSLALITGCGPLGGSEPAPQETTEACENALEAADALLSGPVVEQAEDYAAMSELVEKAFNAGLENDAQEAQRVVDVRDLLVQRGVERGPRVVTLRESYEEYAEKCRG